MNKNLYMYMALNNFHAKWYMFTATGSKQAMHTTTLWKYSPQKLSPTPNPAPRARITTTRWRSWPDAYQRPLCSFAWNSLRTQHACWTIHYTKKAVAKSITMTPVWWPLSSLDVSLLMISKKLGFTGSLLAESVQLLTQDAICLRLLIKRLTVMCSFFSFSFLIVHT